MSFFKKLLKNIVKKQFMGFKQEDNTFISAFLALNRESLKNYKGNIESKEILNIYEKNYKLA